MKNIYWIGARQSDISNESLFKGSITRFGNNNDNNFAFCNNTTTQNYDEFILETIKEIIKVDNNAYFLFANELDAYKYGAEIYNRSMCINNLSIIESLNDKIFSRNFLGEYVRTPCSIILNTSLCSDYPFIKSIFNDEYSEFVLQVANSAGGNNTYLLSEHFTPSIKSNSTYMLVTPYFSKSIAVNLHIAVSEFEYRIMPPSLQVTIDKFKYSGSDFIAYKYLDSKVKSKIINCAKKIATKVKTLGCKGIFGVDLLLIENDVMFIECNYRYQGSSFLLNLGLIENHLPSLFKIRYKSFYNDLHDVPENIYDLSINYSSFRRTNWNKHIKLPFQTKIMQPNNVNFASSDGYLRYEIYTQSIIETIAKQEAQDLYLSD